MTNETLKTELVDDLLKSAKFDATDVHSDLMSRILADAEMAQKPSADTSPRRAPERRGFWQSFGGRPAIAGLAFTTIAGIWIGVSPPTTLDDFTTTFLQTGISYDLGDFMVSAETFMNEG